MFKGLLRYITQSFAVILIGKIKRSILHLLDLENLLAFSISTLLGVFVFQHLSSLGNEKDILTTLISVNGVFSAILITFLFGRISSEKEKKLDIYNEAVVLSQKLTDFRRIINKLTHSHNVWINEDATKNLFGYRYFQITYHDYHKSEITVNNKRPKNPEITKLISDPKFDYSASPLYLAMITMVRNGMTEGGELWKIQVELDNEFQRKQIDYNLYVLNEWLQSEVANVIWYWPNQKSTDIKYHCLSKDTEFILNAAKRINPKYETYELGDKLLEDLADDFNRQYLEELYQSLSFLNKGLDGINRAIVALTIVSLGVGVILPLCLLMAHSQKISYSIMVDIAASINICMLVLFSIKFPFLLRREVKWTI